MVKIIVLACAAGLLAACAARTPVSPPLTASAAPSLLSSPPARVPVKCAQLDASIAAEAAAQAPLAQIITGDTPALSAALMASEARKNDRLRQVLVAYEQCRSASQ